MNKRFLQILALSVCLALLPASAFAKGGKGGGPPADKGKRSSEHGSKDKEKHHDEDNDRDEHHAGRGHDHDHEATAAGPSNRPPGWDKGKKTGWGDCNVPPGLAKQRGCDSSGFSLRERIARSHTTVAHHTTSKAGAIRTATTSHSSRTTRTTASTASTKAVSKTTSTKPTRTATGTQSQTRAKVIVK